MMMMIQLSEYHLVSLRKAAPIVVCLVFLAVHILQTKSILLFVNERSSSSTFSHFSGDISNDNEESTSSIESKSKPSFPINVPSSSIVTHEDRGGELSSISNGPVVYHPDWRMTVDCSAYSRDCVVKQLQRRQRYADYPLQFTKETKHKFPYKWQQSLPEGWEQSFTENAIVVLKDGDKRHAAKNQTAPPKIVKDPSIMKCVQDAQAKSVSEQLDELLEHRLHGRVNNTKHHMVAFTISDYSYAKNQIHDIFAMAHDTVEMPDAFFMVAMDTATAELACEADYPFVMWPQTTDQENNKGALKSVVANTKLEISQQLLERNQSLFFFEMDIWFVQSPKRFLEEQTVDMLFASHFNNPNAVNIGVYSAISNNATREYFQQCIDILEQAPTTHE
jgi:Nucleotide-diphospho-sugar transferase